MKIKIFNRFFLFFIAFLILPSIAISKLVSANQKPITLPRLLKNASGHPGGLGVSAASITGMTQNDEIKYVEIKFYQTNCSSENNVIGASVLNNGTFTISDTGGFNLDGTSLYNLANAQVLPGVGASNVACIRLEFCSSTLENGANCNNRGAACMTFDEDCSSGSSCTSSDSNSANYGTSGAECTGALAIGDSVDAGGTTLVATLTKQGNNNQGNAITSNLVLQPFVSSTPWASPTQLVTTNGTDGIDNTAAIVTATAPATNNAAYHCQTSTTDGYTANT